MSISLFCFTTFDPEKANQCLKKICKDYSKLFPRFYWIDSAEPPSGYLPDIAKEDFAFGGTKSIFTIDVMDRWPEENILESFDEKEIPDITDMAGIVYRYFGEDSVIVTFQLDYVIQVI